MQDTVWVTISAEYEEMPRQRSKSKLMSTNRGDAALGFGEVRPAPKFDIEAMEQVGVA